MQNNSNVAVAEELTNEDVMEFTRQLMAFKNSLPPKLRGLMGLMIAAAEAQMSVTFDPQGATVAGITPFPTADGFCGSTH